MAFDRKNMAQLGAISECPAVVEYDLMMRDTAHQPSIRFAVNQSRVIRQMMRETLNQWRARNKSAYLKDILHFETSFVEPFNS